MADTVDIGQLSAEQQQALESYTAVTAQDVAEAVPILQRSQWNVQIAISKFFDGEGPDPFAEAQAAQDVPTTAARHENLQESLIADSFRPARSPQRERTEAAPRIVPHQPVTPRGSWFLGLLLSPLSWSWKAASLMFRTMIYVLSFLPAPLRPRAVTNRISGGLASTNGRRMLMPRDTAARFKREFDELYGPNDLPFFEGGVAQAHDAAKKELKFLLVIIISPEHDDTEGFVRDTLLDPDVANYLRDPTNNIILWGGNLLDSEAYQVAEGYKSTKYPFSALVCLTPKEGSTRMGIVKRLAGPIPAATYLSELQGAIEKYGAELAVVRAERSAQEVARNLRTEQDSAYERSLAIDRERARQKKEAKAAAAEAEKRAVREAEEAAVRAEKRGQWKTWRAGRVLPEPAAGEKNVVRVALMMPETSGAGRVIRRFPSDAPMEELYAFVECYDTIQQLSDPAYEQSEKSAVEAPEGYEHEYDFTIASTLPRVVFEPSTTATMGEKIGRSGNLIVEEMARESDGEGSEDDSSD